MEQKDRLEKMNEIIRRSWKDEEFKKSLIADPGGVLKAQYGMEIPEGVNLKVIADEPDEITLVLPRAPGAELSDDVLDRVSGGRCEINGAICQCMCGTCL